MGISVKGDLCPGGLCQGDPCTATCGRYASYWNAFLFLILKRRINKKGKKMLLLQIDKYADFIVIMSGIE